jgi:IclR family KDG regulon transcriptional repressor
VFRKSICENTQYKLRKRRERFYDHGVEREPAVAVRRAVALLLTLGGDESLAAGGLGVKRLSELTGHEISRVSRTLEVLADARLVERDPASLAYRLGWRLFALAGRAGGLQLRSEGTRFVRLLADEFEERAYLSVLDGREVLTVVSEAVAHNLQSTGWVGRSHPYVYCTSAGRALLFGHSDEELSALLRDLDFRPPGPNGPTSFADLADRLARERRQGWVYVDEEFEAGLVGVAAPVLDFDGRVVAALNLSGPKFRAGKRLVTAGPRLTEIAAELSGLLGRSPGAGVAEPASA